MKIYLASPFFNSQERTSVLMAATMLRNRGFEVFVPMEHEVPNGKNIDHQLWAKSVFLLDRDALGMADAVVVLYHGLYSDSGTAWECGFAFAQHIPVIVVHLTDQIPSLMVTNGCLANISMQELKSYDFKNLPEKGFEGEQK